jgi:hypothetical protein
VSGPTQTSRRSSRSRACRRASLTWLLVSRRAQRRRPDRYVAFGVERRAGRAALRAPNPSIGLTPWHARWISVCYLMWISVCYLRRAQRHTAQGETNPATTLAQPILSTLRPWRQRRTRTMMTSKCHLPLAFRSLGGSRMHLGSPSQTSRWMLSRWSGGTIPPMSSLSGWNNAITGKHVAHSSTFGVSALPCEAASRSSGSTALDTGHPD